MDQRFGTAPDRVIAAQRPSRSADSAERLL